MMFEPLRTEAGSAGAGGSGRERERYRKRDIEENLATTVGKTTDSGAETKPV